MLTLVNTIVNTLYVHLQHYPQYNFNYGVHDFKTGDNKNQWEVRHGDVVKGEW